MRYGLYLPNFGAEMNPRSVAELAQAAEQAGWDGFFLWDHILYSKSQRLNMLDPWIVLAAIAMTTQNIRLGTTITPIARRRPWKLARETASLDQLSNGRLIISVGLGEPAEAEFGQFGEEMDAKLRAEVLDEGLEIMTGLWRGKPYSYQGKHFQIQKTTFLPKPLQEPRIPIWVGGFWPNQRPFQRAARWDGTIPLKKDGRLFPKDVQEILVYIQEIRTSNTPFDFALIGSRHTSGYKKLRGIEKVAVYAEAGITWWLESLYMQRDSIQEMYTQIELGPPKP